MIADWVRMAVERDQGNWWYLPLSSHSLLVCASLREVGLDGHQGERSSTTLSISRLALAPKFEAMAPGCTSSTSTPNGASSRRRASLEVVGLGEAVAEHLRRFLQHHHERAARVGLEERPQCRATDDQDLEGLDDGADLAAGEQEAPEDTGENDDDADDF